MPLSDLLLVAAIWWSRPSSVESIESETIISSALWLIISTYSSKSVMRLFFFFSRPIKNGFLIKRNIPASNCFPVKKLYSLYLCELPISQEDTSFSFCHPTFFWVNEYEWICKTSKDSKMFNVRFLFTPGLVWAHVA